MSEQNTGGRIRIRDGFSKSWDKMWKEKQTLALIGLLYALILTIAGWGMMTEQFDMIERAAQGDLDVSSEPRVPTIADGIYYIVALCVGAAYYVSLVRLYIGGRERVLDGGMPELAKRSLWVIWRYICMFALVLVIGFPFIFVVSSVIGAMGDSSLAALLTSLFFAAGLIGFMVAIVVTIAAVIDTSMDISTSIRNAFSLLKGYRLRLGATYLLFTLLLSLIAIIIAGILGAIIGKIFSWTVGLMGFMVVIYVISTFINYALMGGVAELMAAIRAEKHVDIEV